MSLATARQLSTIARRIDDLPISVAAFRRGELTLDQMATIARRAPGWVDDQALEFGVSLTVNQLTRVLRDYPFPAFDDDGNEVMPADLVDASAETQVETSADDDAAVDSTDDAPTGGDTDTWNLLLICSHHHRQHHRGRLGIAGNADLPRDADRAVEFTDRTGRRILPSEATPITPIGPIPPSTVPYGHPLGERLRPGSVHFAPPSHTTSNQPGAA